MRRFGLFLISLILLALVGVGVLWQLSRTDFFWRWGGKRLVALAQERIQGELNVEHVRGNPLTGLTFEGITLKEPQGEVLRADRMELRFSLWSVVKLQPAVAYVALHHPRLSLSRDEQGRWNASRLLKPGPGGAPPFMALDFSRIVIKRGEISLTIPEAARTFSEIDFQGSAALHRPGRPGQTVTVSGADLSFSIPQGRYRVHTGFSLTREVLDIPSLTVYSQVRPLVTLAGQIKLSQPEPLFNLALELEPGAGVELHRVWPLWPEDWNLVGKFQANGPRSQLQISGDGSLQQAGYYLKGSVGRMNGEWRYDLGFEFRGLHGRMLTPFKPVWAEKVKDLGPLEIQARLKGEGLAWPPRRLEWALNCTPFAYQEAQVKEFKLALAGDPRLQRLDCRAAGNFGAMELTASGPLLTAGAGDVKIQTEGLQPQTLGAGQLAQSNITGKYSGTFSLIPLRTAGELEARGQLIRQPLKEFKGRLNWDGVKLAVPQAKISLGTLAADFKGSVEKKWLEVQYRGHAAAVGAWPWLPPEWRGRLEGEGAVKGPWTGPQMTFHGKGQGLSGAGFGAQSLSIRAEAAGWPPQSGRLELQGSGLKTPLVQFSQARLTCQGEAGRWRFSFNGSYPQGKADLEGQADLKARPYAILVDRGRFQYQDFTAANTTPVQLRLDQGWELSPATFRVNDGRLTMHAAARAGRLTGRVEFGNFPTDIMCVVGVSCYGKINGQMDLNGDPARPLIQGQFAWGPGQWGNFAFKSLSTSINYRDARLYLAGRIEETSAGPGLSWEGHIPLTLSLLPLKYALGESGLNFRVQGEKANLAMLTGLTPEIPRAEGPLEVMAVWQGNPRQPTVSGHLRWGEGTITFRQAGAAFRILPGQARLQGDRLIIPDLTLMSGGAARLSGEVTLNRVEVKGVLQDFITVKRTGSEVAGSGALTLSGPWSSPLLKGRVNVVRASFIPGFFRAEKHEDVTLVRPPEPPPPANAGPQPPKLSFYKNLGINLDLEAPGNVWIKDKRLNAEMAGKLTIMKETDQPARVRGEVHTLRGTYELQGRIFKIEKGVVRLPGRPGEDVTVEGKATHEMANLTLIINATGMISRPLVRLESIPPLPPQDVLAYLLFGRPARSLTREETLSAGQQAVGILGGITAQKLQELLGKDFPLVGDVTLRTPQVEAGRQAVGVTKPLTKDLSVSFERKYDPLHRDQTEQVILEYRINRYLSVESQMGRRNTGGDVMLNLDF
jgi:translocation and assembly module TamB